MSMPSSLALALALSDRALSQPWSAAGALNAILTFDAWAAPSSVAALVAVAAGVLLEPLLSSPPQGAMPKPRATPAHSTGTTFLNFMGALLLIGLPFSDSVLTCCGAAAARRRG